APLTRERSACDRAPHRSGAGPGGAAVRPAGAARSARCGALDVVVPGVLEPCEHLTQLAARGLDGVLLLLGAQLLELRSARGLVIHEALGERSVLDVGEDGLHVLLDLRRDDAGAGDVVAVLGRVGAGPALLGD